MQIDIRPVARLRGPAPLRLGPALGPAFDALTTSSVDLSTLKVTCDWIQYRSNFAEPVRCRPVLAERPREVYHGTGLEAGGDPGAAPSPPVPVPASALELAIDLRRAGDLDLATSVKQALAEHPGGDGQGRTFLEDWTPASASCIWRFNALYWQALARGRRSPGGSTSRRCPAARATRATSRRA